MDKNFLSDTVIGSCVFHLKKLSVTQSCAEAFDMTARLTDVDTGEPLKTELSVRPVA